MDKKYIKFEIKKHLLISSGYYVMMYYKNIHLFYGTDYNGNAGFHESIGGTLYKEQLNMDFDECNVDLKSIFGDNHIDYTINNGLFYFKDKENCNKVIDILNSILLIKKMEG